MPLAMNRLKRIKRMSVVFRLNNCSDLHSSAQCHISNKKIFVIEHD